jgi:hypothetical protein
MTVRQMIRIVIAWGLVTVFVQSLSSFCDSTGSACQGLATVGGLLALVQLGGLIGAPLALILNRQVRSASVVVVLSIALSMALAALAVQVLVWFEAATRLLLVASATAYGVGLAALLNTEPDHAERQGRSRLPGDAARYADPHHGEAPR